MLSLEKLLEYVGDQLLVESYEIYQGQIVSITLDKDTVIVMLKQIAFADRGEWLLVPDPTKKDLIERFVLEDLSIISQDVTSLELMDGGMEYFTTYTFMKKGDSRYVDFSKVW